MNPAVMARLKGLSNDENTQFVRIMVIDEPMTINVRYHLLAADNMSGLPSPYTEYGTLMDVLTADSVRAQY